MPYVPIRITSSYLSKRKASPIHGHWSQVACDQFRTWPLTSYFHHGESHILSEPQFLYQHNRGADNYFTETDISEDWMILHKNLLTRQRDHYILTKCLFMKKPLAGLLGKLLHKKKKNKKKAQRCPSSAFRDFSGMRNLKRYCLQPLGLEPLTPLIWRSGGCGYTVIHRRKRGLASALLSVRPKAIPSTAHKHIRSLRKHWQTLM